MASTDAAASGDAGPDTILRTRGLTRRFGEVSAVDDVDLAVRRGEFRSVIGPNGAGKTTFFNLVTGVLEPTAGTIEYDGRDVTGEPPHRLIQRGIARSFQISNVFDGLGVHENVRLAAQSSRYGGFRPRRALFRRTDAFDDINAKATAVLERIGLAERADDLAGTLAYGDKRRLEIGLVLATEPELVLLDEPTAGMSGEETDRTIRLIKEVLAEKTLLLVEHDIDLVMEISEAITVLHRGAVIADGTPQEISGDDRVQRAYLGGHA